jgi:hypothetical protein
MFDDIDHLTWRKSSRCANGACLEFAHRAETTYVRDSREPAGPRLDFTLDAWNGFVGAVKAGSFDAVTA